MIAGTVLVLAVDLAPPGAAAQGQAQTLTAVSCASTTACLAVGGAAVVASSDGGAHWATVTSPPQAFELTALSCRSATRCEVVGSTDGDAGAAYGTTTGGATWHAQPIDQPGGVVLAISCASSAVCVATGNGGGVFTTVDSGRTWTGQTLTDPSLINGIDCPSTTVCEAVAYSGHAGLLGLALRTTDGGRTWVEQSLPTTIPFPQGVSCPSVDNCVLVGQRTVNAGAKQVGVIAATTDGGTTWRRQRVPAGYTDLSAIACPETGICTTVGYGPRGILVTADGGTTWTPKGPATTDLRGVSCPTVSDCTAVGQTNSGEAAIYSTTDGGRSWHHQRIG